MATMSQVSGQGNPDDKNDPVSVVLDALNQYADLPDEEMARVGGPEEYILQRLSEAGWRLVRRTEWNEATGTDAEEWTL